jgi:hypothetical protein
MKRKDNPEPPFPPPNMKRRCRWGFHKEYALGRVSDISFEHKTRADGTESVTAAIWEEAWRCELCGTERRARRVI